MLSGSARTIHGTTSSARVLLRADSIAPAEIRFRPAAREVVVQVARDPGAPPTITQLAIGLGVL